MPVLPGLLLGAAPQWDFRTTDDCKSWSEIKEVKPSTFGFGVVVHPIDPNTAWFVPAGSDQLPVPPDRNVVVTGTRDGGKTIDCLTDGLPQQNAYDIVYRHALDIDQTGNRLIFGSKAGSVWISDDGGDS